VSRVLVGLLGLCLTSALHLAAGSDTSLEEGQGDLNLTVRGHDLLFAEGATNGLLYMTTEVSNALYREFDPSHTSGRWREFDLDGEQQPVVRVTFGEANAFCTWLTAELSRHGVPCTVRIPSAQEWEAVASPDEGAFPWGRSILGLVGNVGDLSLRNLGVPASPFFNPTSRLVTSYDDGHVVSCDVTACWTNLARVSGLAGNVSEWTRDVEHFGEQDLPLQKIRGMNWRWGGMHDMYEVSAGGIVPAGVRSEFLGFRPVLELVGSRSDWGRPLEEKTGDRTGVEREGASIRGGVKRQKVP